MKLLQTQMNKKQTTWAEMPSFEVDKEKTKSRRFEVEFVQKISTPQNSFSKNYISMLP